MTEGKKLWIVDREALERAFMEQIKNELYNDGRTGIDDAGCCSWVQRISQESINDCFSQKNSKEITPELEHKTIDKLLDIYKIQGYENGDLKFAQDVIEDVFETLRDLVSEGDASPTEHDEKEGEATKEKD